MDYVLKDRRRLPRRHKAERHFVKQLRRAAADPEWIETLEHFRDAIIRASLARPEPSTGGMVVALVGTRGGEGTSQLGLLLSLALGAQMRHRVAFIDGRFNPSRFDAVSYLLALSKNSCAVEKGGTLLAGYYNEAHPNIYFLKNAASEHSLEFFSDKELRNCLSELRRFFDFTVIDMPPLLKESSNTFIAPLADLTYLVVTPGKTSLADVDRAIDMFAEVGTKISGVILNHQKTPVLARPWRDYFF